MPPRSKWGVETFKKNNPDDMKVMATILQKLQDLGETGNESDSVQLPDVIHQMDPKWQRYNAKSFRVAIKKCRAILSKIQLELLLCRYLFYCYVT
jgi:hypothetical protein